MSRYHSLANGVMGKSPDFEHLFHGLVLPSQRTWTESPKLPRIAQPKPDGAVVQTQNLRPSSWVTWTLFIQEKCQISRNHQNAFAVKIPFGEM